MQNPPKVPEVFDVHLHLPAEAQKKDGPSAGVACVNGKQLKVEEEFAGVLELAREGLGLGGRGIDGFGPEVGVWVQYCVTRGVYPSQALQYWVQCVAKTRAELSPPPVPHRSSIGPPFSVTCNSPSNVLISLTRNHLSHSPCNHETPATSQSH